MMFMRSLLLVSLVTCYINATAQDSHTVGSADAGKQLYEQTCLACHQADGSGVPNLAPPLIQGTFIPDKQRLITIVLNGMQDVEIRGEVYSNPMPAFDYLSDKEIADVLTFVRSNFDNKGDAVTEDDVKRMRAKKEQ